jgi:hypothetical protein
MPMLARRKFVIRLLTVATSLLAFGFIVLGAELLGTVKSVDADAKTIIVTPKDGGDDVTVKVNDSTEWYTKKGKIDNFELPKAKGKNVKITHEDKVASKIEFQKGAPKKKDAN